VTTPPMKAIFRHVWEVLEGEPKVIGCVRDDGNLTVDVLRCADRPDPGITSWATIGMYEGETGKVADGKPLRVELVSLCDSAVDDYGNMLASCAFNVLSGDYGMQPDTVFPDIVSQYRPDVTMKHMLFVPIFSWDGPDNLELDGTVVTWLQAVPISQGELTYARRNGGNALATLLEERDVDVADIDRESVV
jgi:antitoxin YqcF